MIMFQRVGLKANQYRDIWGMLFVFNWFGQHILRLPLAGDSPDSTRPTSRLDISSACLSLCWLVPPSCVCMLTHTHTHACQGDVRWTSVLHFTYIRSALQNITCLWSLGSHEKLIVCRCTISELPLPNHSDHMKNLQCWLKIYWRDTFTRRWLGRLFRTPPGRSGASRKCSSGWPDGDTKNLGVAHQN